MRRMLIKDGKKGGSEYGELFIWGDVPTRGLGHGRALPVLPKSVVKPLASAMGILDVHLSCRSC